MLIDHNYCPDSLTIAVAAQNGDLDIFEKLQPLKRLRTSLAFNKGLLYYAVKGGNTKILQELIKAGEDVNEICNTLSPERSPLQKATEDGNLTMVNILLEAGADVNVPAAEGYGATALQLAAIKGLLGLANTFIDLGASVNAPRARKGGRTTIEGAAEHGKIDMIVFLLGQGVKTTGNGRLQYLRAIKFAERRGHLTAARLLRNHREWTLDDHSWWDELEDLPDEGWEDFHEDYFEDLRPISKNQEETLLGSEPTEVRAEVTAEESHPEPVDVTDAFCGVPGDMDWQNSIGTFETMAGDFDEPWIGAGYV
ncbi:sexual development regulator VELC [Colletotrichum spaethianum]|uniref:Sexual development regulator VELC n=1 Tax=Colletotrichum spaethianum TaxID=700344 RepID=A0AA37PH87_9PEZI|nr:sexual development regulator VELC [Colletotrichum spaethianum]GKT52295.1 sexual development regulator VELC [Colletotrichum spaethianum]